ncbi:hypothetical protein ABD77_11385 [Brevibacillus formosus]|nr:hypothetical protein [Brevibacillus formosus]
MKARPLFLPSTKENLGIFMRFPSHINRGYFVHFCPAKEEFMCISQKKQSFQSKKRKQMYGRAVTRAVRAG